VVKEASKTRKAVEELETEMEDLEAEVEKMTRAVERMERRGAPMPLLPPIARDM